MNETELKKLIAEQAADDADTIRPERHGGDHGVPVLSLDALNEQGFDPGYIDPGFAEVEDRLSDIPEVVNDRAAQRSSVRSIVDGLSSFEQDVYYLVFGQGLSVREAAGELKSVSHMTVQRTVEKIKKSVAEALAVEDTDEGTAK